MLTSPQSPPPFEVVYDHHVRYVWRLVYRLGVPQHDVEDVCQDIFTVVHRKLPEFESRSTIKTWLYGIANKCVSDYRRRAHRRHEIPSENPSDGMSEDATQLRHVELGEARRLMETILNQLDADKRTTFVFYELEGLTMSEVTEIMNCPLQTAYSRLHAARRHVEVAAERWKGSNDR